MFNDDEARKQKGLAISGKRSANCRRPLAGLKQSTYDIKRRPTYNLKAPKTRTTRESFGPERFRRRFFQI